MQWPSGQKFTAAFFTKMSDSHRQNSRALIALGLALFSVVAVCFITARPNELSSHPLGQIYAEAPQPKDNNGQPIAKRIYWGFFTADDTVAQWVMAFFTIVATGISLKAVFLIRDTLGANAAAVDQAKTANEIAKQSSDAALAHARKATELDLRPYVAFSGIEFEKEFVVENGGFSIGLKNFGRTAAREVFFARHGRFISASERAKRLDSGKMGAVCYILAPDQEERIHQELGLGEVGIDRLQAGERYLMEFVVAYNPFPDRRDVDRDFLFVSFEWENGQIKGSRLAMGFVRDHPRNQRDE
jgi:hypothetical protein